MASGGKRTAGDRVLESKHVIGLFLLMLLFSGVFFSLGYVMGRNQYEGQVRAAGSWSGRPDAQDVQPQPVVPAKKSSAAEAAPSGDGDPATTSSNSDWEFYGNNKPAKSEPRLEPVPKPSDSSSAAKASNNKTASVQPVSAPVKTAKQSAAPLIPNGAYVLQVAALQKQDDALAVAGTLQKKNYACFVQPPQKDKDSYYRVQVGPFKDRKAADAAKQGLENEGFKAFYVKH
jgi:cell division septation protein DedD